MSSEDDKRCSLSLSKEFGITRKFFENLRMMLDTVRLTRGTPLTQYTINIKIGEK